MLNPTDRSLLGDVSSIAIGRSFMCEQLARTADVSHLVPARKPNGLRATEKPKRDRLEEILSLDMIHKRFLDPRYYEDPFDLPLEELRDLMGMNA